MAYRKGTAEGSRGVLADEHREHLNPSAANSSPLALSLLQASLKQTKKGLKNAMSGNGWGFSQPLEVMLTRNSKLRVEERE